MIERRSLFKYFSEEKYADAFRDGQLLFRALSYFRDFEDRQVRGDESEGQSKYRPATGLVIHNETHKTSFVLEGFSFASAVRQDEIFIFCLSMDHGQRFYDAFGAVACVEVTDVSTFCKRVQSALPDNATSPDVEPNRPRLGHRVGYYDDTEGGSPRWALPGTIAVSKLRQHAWQQEFRLAFSVTDAFDFQDVKTRLIHDDHREARNVVPYPQSLVSAASLRDITRIHRRG